jgi:hypothetical protein
LICARDLQAGASPFCSGRWAGLPAGLFFFAGSRASIAGSWKPLVPTG